MKQKHGAIRHAFIFREEYNTLGMEYNLREISQRRQYFLKEKNRKNKIKALLQEVYNKKMVVPVREKRKNGEKNIIKIIFKNVPRSLSVNIEISSYKDT